MKPVLPTRDSASFCLITTTCIQLQRAELEAELVEREVITESINKYTLNQLYDLLLLELKGTVQQISI